MQSEVPFPFIIEPESTVVPSEDFRCEDCKAWRGRCIKGKLNRIAWSIKCELFGRRGATRNDTARRWLIIGFSPLPLTPCEA